MSDFTETLSLRLQSVIPAEEYHRWLAPAAWSYDRDSASLLLTVPTAFHQRWILRHYAQIIFRQALGCGCRVSRLQFNCARRGGQEARLLLAAPPPLQAPPPDHAAIDPAHSFESFLVRPSNRLAALALEKFADSYEALPAQVFYLSSPGPWGKSHLLDAVVGRLRGRVRLLQLGPADPGEDDWDEAEVIVADDVHLLELRPEIQKRLIMAFDRTFNRRPRILAAGPASPVKLQNLGEQLRSRLASGLMLKIDPPEFELMTDLAASQLQAAGLAAGPDLPSALAKEARGDPRRLAGFIASAGFIAANTDLDLNDALLTVMRDKSPEAGLIKPEIGLIIETVAASFALKAADLTGHSRLSRTAWPRRAAMYLARQMTGLTTSQIGGAFGGRDHSTVIHALKKINEEMKNPAKARIVENIRRAIIMGEKEAAID